MKRRTIASEFVVEGIGLHRGKKNILIVKPYSGKGIIFSDSVSGKKIVADLSSVVSFNRCTVIGCDGFEVSTIEHLLSCFFAFNIDDVEIEISGDEVPAFDGSSLPLCNIIKKIKIIEKEEDADVITIDEPFLYISGDSFYRIEKDNGFKVDCSFENSNPLVGLQNFIWSFDTDSYISDIAPARTFAFEQDLEYLKKNNLALGGSLENAVVIGRERILNEGGLRFKDEFVRHKILDLLGDLKLIGMRLDGIKITAKRPCHKSNISLARIIKARSIYE